MRTFMLKRLLLLSLCWSAFAASNPSRVIHYEVSYIGIPLLDMVLTWVEDDTSVHIAYDNQLKPFIAFFHPIHNVYRVHFMRDDFSPLSWSKTVSEGKMQFELVARRSNDGKTAIYEDGQSFDLPENVFTVFSATHYLASKARDLDFYPVKVPVFIDGEIWEATARRFDVENPHPDHSLGLGQVLIQTDLHYLSGESLIKDNDILTSVIATEGTQFLLWVTPDGNYTKAQFGRFPKAVILEQVNN